MTHLGRVVAVVIERGGLLLIARRPDAKRHGGKWEFPGGKVESGENSHEAAVRELEEELGVHVVETTLPHFSVEDCGSTFVIDFVRATIDGIPNPLEHEALAWVALQDLNTFDLAPSDRAYADFLLTDQTAV